MIILLKAKTSRKWRLVLKQKRSNGAGGENRTLITCLEGRYIKPLYDARVTLIRTIAQRLAAAQVVFYPSKCAIIKVNVMIL